MPPRTGAQRIRTRFPPAAALTVRSARGPVPWEIDRRRPLMSRTVRSQPDRRALNDAHALFHLQAGGAKVLNLRHIPGDTSRRRS